MPSNSDAFSDEPLLDALDERSGPALPLSDHAADAAVRAAVSRALPTRVAPGSRRRISALLLAAALGMTGVAAAFVITQKGWSGSPAQKAISAPLASVRALVHSPNRATEAVPTPSASTAPAQVETPSVVNGATDESANPPSPERPGGARPSNVLDLLKAANQLRRQARWAEAEHAYAQVASAYGNTAQGPVAALAAASLRLEHLGDPRGALVLYQRALRASSLSAEAQLGIADCYRALGERAAEITALQRLTAAHPEALFHERAVRRLRALEAREP